MDNQALELWRSCKRPRGQCSSSPIDDYDVFLNHRGPDVKSGFMAHLDEALRAAGLNPFLDKASLRTGDLAFKSINNALEVAKVHVAVVSKGYAESKYCLIELVAIMRSGKPVIPVFYDVEPSHLRWVENGPFAAAFEKHKTKKAPEQVEEWVDALKKLADISGICFRLSDYKGDEAELKREVMNAVLNFLPPIIEALEVESHLVGVKEHVNTCINKLEEMSGATSLLGLIGMGGIGKTTLAKEIYNKFVGRRKFQAMSILQIDHDSPSSMEVGQSLLDGLQKQLLWDLLQVGESNHGSYKYWYHRLSSRGSVLIVLDDLRDKALFDKLILNRNVLAPGSCIIVTSRDRHLVKVIGGDTNFYLHEVTPLGFDDSQKLFNLNAFGNEEAPEKFKALANGVRQACGGLPLALKVVGSSLSDKKSDEDLRCLWPEAVEALKEDPKVTRVLKWSYDCLSRSEKLMFVDIACVFYGWKKEEALKIWQGCKKCSSCCGFGAPNTSLRHLIDKSLIVIERSGLLAMHGLLRDLGQSIGISEESHLWGGRAMRAAEGKIQAPNKVRAINFANYSKSKIKLDNFAKMTNLHFLVFNGCDVSGEFGSNLNQLRWFQWKDMPLTHVPPMLDLSNLVSLDFSSSTKLANVWAESDPALETLPNLLNLDMSYCKSITTLPDSIGRLSRLQVLDLRSCENLQKLPSSIGQLTELQDLILSACGSLEALPDTITALSGLQLLHIDQCSSISMLPTTLGVMSGLNGLGVDLVTDWQAVGIGQLSALQTLSVTKCTDEGVSVLDRLGTLRNLDQLVMLMFIDIHSPMTKLPETMGLLTNLDTLDLYSCHTLQELPNTIGQLKMLRSLSVTDCRSLETLPDSLGALTSLQELHIRECTAINQLPTSIGHLSSLLDLRIEFCSGLQSLPDSFRHLNALKGLLIRDCGSLEGLGLVRSLQGLRIWGCTSITKLPGSCLMVVDSTLWNPAVFLEGGRVKSNWVFQKLKQFLVVEANDCGFFRLTQNTESGRVILQRVYVLPCNCKPPGLIPLNEFVATEWQAGGIIGQLNALKTLRVTECTDEAIAVLDGSGLLGNLEQLSEFLFYECSSMTKLPVTMSLLTNLGLLELYDCGKVQELPNSIGQLKVLTNLHLRKCSSLESLPDSLGELTSLQQLLIVQCRAFTKLPTSIGRLSSLRDLRIEGCGELQALPESLRQLNALVELEIFDCGSLEGLGLLRLLQGLRIWGCTSITELPGACLKVVDSEFRDPGDLYDAGEYRWVCRNLKELLVLETNDCGFLRCVQTTQTGQVILQRVYKLPCCKMTMV